MIPSPFYKRLFHKIKNLYHLWSQILKSKFWKRNHLRSLCSLKLSTVSYIKLKWEYPNCQWNQGIRLRTNWDKCFGYTIIHFLLLSRSTTKNMYIRVCERNSCHLNGPICLLMKFELTEYLGCCECLRSLFFHSTF